MGSTVAAMCPNWPANASIFTQVLAHFFTSRHHAGLMVKAAQTLAQISAALRQPRAQVDVYRDYNMLRQRYILKQAAGHFQLRDDDPAPLYGKTLLDAGCGESTIAEFLALSGADITAIDANPELLARAEASAAAFGAPIRFINARAEKLINSQQKFDVILALDLLEDTEDPAKLVWVLRQLLKPGGIVIFSHISRTPRAWLYHVLLSGYIYARTPRGSRSWWRFHTPAQLRRICAKAGLRLGNVQGLRFSASKQRWKNFSRPHPRYLATATAL